MAKGSVAKDNVEKMLAKAFGSDFIGTVDKKIYVWADDGGEKVQIAMSLTCPKVFVDTGAVPVADETKKGDGLYFDEEVVTPVAAATEATRKQISPEEKARIEDIMRKLGL